LEGLSFVGDAFAKEVSDMMRNFGASEDEIANVEKMYYVWRYKTNIPKE
jgi:hypothetical protein